MNHINDFIPIISIDAIMVVIDGMIVDDVVDVVVVDVVVVDDIIDVVVVTVDRGHFTAPLVLTNYI